MSADRDMFRYIGLDNAAERVVADFTFEEGESEASAERDGDANRRGLHRRG